jgi:hypothetical protein
LESILPFSPRFEGNELLIYHWPWCFGGRQG